MHVADLGRRSEPERRGRRASRCRPALTIFTAGRKGVGSLFRVEKTPDFFVRRRVACAAVEHAERCVERVIV
jgi:hypothetical protein